MDVTKERIQQHLKSFTIRQLFVEEFLWNKPKEPALPIVVDTQTYTLRPIADKSGVKVYVCDPDAQGRIPADPILRRIEREVTQSAFEHILIYSDAAKENQVWQWVKREHGKAPRQHFNRVHKGQSGELLAQKLRQLVFPMEAEPSAAEVAERNKKAFDTEPVTKKFFTRFQKELVAFQGFIDGITAQGDKEWYASLMLNRLMFIYFIQRQGFLNATSNDELNGEHEYLRKRLIMVQTQYGHDEFHTFYRYFLLNLFSDLNTQEGKRTRSHELDTLLGKIPYLNGGLFDVHQLEQENLDIRIPDMAFERIFDFFDEFDWHLDDRPLRNEKEINPDVLGYIFEKYINQKQMGAYYTKEDITEYISKNTIIPYLFEATKRDCEVAFEPGRAVWSLLCDNPDDYIYEAVAKGVNRPLPAEIEAGLHDITKRGEWNRPAPEEFALPTEIWREVVARRQRYEEVHTKLANGDVTSINDLITYNLDICKFALDVITYCEGTDLLNAFYKHIQKVTVLDPTCGSGAFLFAALNILKPLYEACLTRMEVKVDERERLDFLTDPKYRRVPTDIKDFQKILQEVATHHNRDYFILKSIIINNLYGVDIMEEATEICKLRLFLKLVSQVGRVTDIEPLPDIDFNIRAGNTLIGFTTLEDVRATVNKDISSMLFSTDMLNRIEQQAKAIDFGFQNFRKLQTELDIKHWDIAEAKQDLRNQLGQLNTELDVCLAAEYKIDKNNKDEATYNKEFKAWQQSHQPFHWYAQFYGIMENGGFDVIIGNPPYLDLKELSNYTMQGFTTAPTRNLYALVLERCQSINSHQGKQGYIVPVSSIATEGYFTLQQILGFRKIVYSSYDDRPSHLFDGLDKNTLSILLVSNETPVFDAISTRLLRWSASERDKLFQVLQYEKTPTSPLKGSFPKIGSKIENAIWHKIFLANKPIHTAYSQEHKYITYYSRKVNSFLQVLDFTPEVRDGSGNLRPPSEFKELSFYSQEHAAVTFCCLNSTLFRWFLDVVSDGSHLNRREVDNFPFSVIEASSNSPDLFELAKSLSNRLRQTSFKRVMRYKHDTLTVQCIIPKLSKGIIDNIDRILANHYGFTDEELDFIINYDIKYRMGRNSDEESEA